MHNTYTCNLHVSQVVFFRLFEQTKSKAPSKKNISHTGRKNIIQTTQQRQQQHHHQQAGAFSVAIDAKKMAFSV